MKRRADLDLLRVLCMCAVVYLHAASPSFSDLGNLPLWEMSNVVNSFAALAVPLFFMMSGALLLNHPSTEKLSALPRRIARVAVPLAAWSVLALGRLWAVSGPEAAAEALKPILNTPANTAYWFLYALIPIYLLAPLLRVLVSRLTAAQWRYMLLLWGVLTLGLNTLRPFLPAEWQAAVTPHWTLNLDMVGGYLGYFLFGAYLERREELPSRSLLVWGTLVAALLTITAAHVDSYVLLAASSTRFTGYLTVFTALRCAGVFLLCKALLGRWRLRTPILPILSGCSFCVYLAHPLVIFLMARPWYAMTGSWVVDTVPAQLLYYLLILGVSLLLSVVLASIPGLCYLFTGQTLAAARESGSLLALFRKRPRKDPQ